MFLYCQSHAGYFNEIHLPPHLTSFPAKGALETAKGHGRLLSSSTYHTRKIVIAFLVAAEGGDLSADA